MGLRLSFYWHVSVAVLLSAIAILIPDIVFASNITPMGNVLCTVVGWFTGNVGKGLATIAVTIVGVGALLGKVSWGMAMNVGIGVAILFGAAGIVSSMGAGVTNVNGLGSPTCG